MLSFATLLLGPALALADCPGLRVTDAWLREPPPGATGTAGYLQLHNDGPAPLSLADWRSEHFDMTMLHETVQAGERSSMRERATLEIPAGGHASLAPGGLHLMLMGPHAPLRAGDAIKLTVSCGGKAFDFLATVKTDEVQ